MPGSTEVTAPAGENEPVAVIGLRGFPGVQGGVERHCEELYPRLAAAGVPIVVFTRARYMREAPARSVWRGVHLRKVWSPPSAYLETFCHTATSVLLARAAGIRVVHLHAVGSGLAVPLAAALGMRVVFTHHGRDYMRQKWGGVARAVLRRGERLAVERADQVIAVSHEVERWLAEEYGRSCVCAANGVTIEVREREQVEAAIAPLGVHPGSYAIAVSRLVPEKGLHDLIDALAHAPSVERLLIVGGADHPSAYERQLRARASERVRFLGALPHETAMDLIRGARVLALPSYHEGLPIVLLEALACGTPVVASDIAPHREVLRGEGAGFWIVPAGDATHLGRALDAAWSLADGERSAVAARLTQIVRERYSWSPAVEAAAAAYRAVRRGA